jgi:hypothetical protein
MLVNLKSAGYGTSCFPPCLNERRGQRTATATSAAAGNKVAKPFYDESLMSARMPEGREFPGAERIVVTLAVEVPTVILPLTR